MFVSRATEGRGSQRGRREGKRGLSLHLNLLINFFCGRIRKSFDGVTCRTPCPWWAEGEREGKKMRE
jgi:hypothetical protein